MNKKERKKKVMYSFMFMILSAMYLIMIYTADMFGGVGLLLNTFSVNVFGQAKIFLPMILIYFFASNVILPRQNHLKTLLIQFILASYIATLLAIFGVDTGIIGKGISNIFITFIGGVGSRIILPFITIYLIVRIGFKYNPFDIINFDNPKNKVQAKTNDLIVASPFEEINNIFNEFGIKAKAIAIDKSLLMDSYKINLENGTRVSTIISSKNLQEFRHVLDNDNIDFRSVNGALFLDVPQKERPIIYLRDNLDATTKVNIPIGTDLYGTTLNYDYTQFPHLLVGGITGSGKSVFINALICSLVSKNTPNDLRFIMIDPKRVELSFYKNLPHLLTNIVTDCDKAIASLTLLVDEMEKRYKLFEKSQVRNLDGYNSKFISNSKLPRIICIIDELSDLMDYDSKIMEELLHKLAHLSRASGIHLVVATQKPQANVIPTKIRDNIPTKIAFFSATTESGRTILNESGAEKLIGNGDMLFKTEGQMINLQGFFIEDFEVLEHVQKAINKYGHIKQQLSIAENNFVPKKTKEDKELDNIIDFVLSQKSISKQMLKDKFRIGDGKANNVLSELDKLGLLGDNDSQGRRIIKHKNNNNVVSIF